MLMAAIHVQEESHATGRHIGHLFRHRHELRGFGAKSIALFGSATRGETQPESDIDILVELDRTVGILAFLRLQYRLEELLGKRVDLVTQAALKRQFRDRILKEAIYAGKRVEVSNRSHSRSSQQHKPNVRIGTLFIGKQS